MTLLYLHTDLQTTSSRVLFMVVKVYMDSERAVVTFDMTTEAVGNDDDG